MANASLTVSLPGVMRDFIETQLREGTFSTPSEYIRSLIRLDQEHAFRHALEAFVVQRTTAKQKTGRGNGVPASSRKNRQ